MSYHEIMFRAWSDRIMMANYERYDVFGSICFVSEDMIRDFVNAVVSEFKEQGLMQRLQELSKEDDDIATWKFIIENTSRINTDNMLVLHEAIIWIKSDAEINSCRRQEYILLLRELAQKLDEYIWLDSRMHLAQKAYRIRHKVVMLATYHGSDGIPLLQELLSRYSHAPVLDSALEAIGRAGKKSLPVLEWLHKEGYGIDQYMNTLSSNIIYSLEDGIPVLHWLVSNGYVVDFETVVEQVGEMDERILPLLTWIASQVGYRNVFIWLDKHAVFRTLSLKERDWLALWMLEHANDIDLLKRLARLAGKSDLTGIGVLELIWRKCPESSILTEAVKGAAWRSKEDCLPVLEWICDRTDNLDILRKIALVASRCYPLLTDLTRTERELRIKNNLEYLRREHVSLLIKLLSKSDDNTVMQQVARCAGCIGNEGIVVLEHLLSLSDDPELLQIVAESVAKIGHTGVPILEHLMTKIESSIVIKHVAIGFDRIRTPEDSILEWLVSNVDGPETLSVTVKAAYANGIFNASELVSIVEKFSDPKISEKLVEIANAMGIHDIRLLNEEFWERIAKCSEEYDFAAWSFIIKHSSNLAVLQEATKWIEAETNWANQERKQAIPLLRDIAGKVRRSVLRDKVVAAHRIFCAYGLRSDVCRLATRCGSDGIPLLNVMLERDHSLLDSVLSQVHRSCKAALPILKWLVSQRYIIKKRNLGMRLSIDEDSIPVWEWLIEEGYEINMEKLAAKVLNAGDRGVPVLKWMIAKTDLSSVVMWTAKHIGPSLQRGDSRFVTWLLENSSDMEVLKMIAYEAGRSERYGIGFLEQIGKKGTDQSILLEAAKGVWSLSEIEVPILEWIFDRAMELEVIKAIVMMDEEEYLSYNDVHPSFKRQVRERSMETRHSLLLLKVLDTNTDAEMLKRVVMAAGWLGDVGTIVLYQLVERTENQEVLLWAAQSASSIGESGIPLLERLLEKVDPRLVVNHAAIGLTLFREPDVKVLKWIIGRKSNGEVLLLIAKAAQATKKIDRATMLSLIECTADSEVLLQVLKALNGNEAITDKSELLIRILEKCNDSNVVLEVAWSAAWLGEDGIPVLERISVKGGDVDVFHAIISGAVDKRRWYCCIPIFEWVKSKTVDSEVWEYASKRVTVEYISTAILWLKDQGLYQKPDDG